MDTWVWSVLLLVVAIIIVGIEVFVPSGGLLGVMAAITLLGSIMLGFIASFQFGMLMLIVACFLVPIVVMVAIQFWPNTPIGRRIISRPPSDDEVLPDLDEERHLKSLVGQRGLAITKMLPSGIVEIEGRQYDANSDGVPIDADQTVEVTAVKMRRLEVRLVEANEPPPRRTETATPDDVLSQPIDSLGLEALDDPLA